MKKVALVTGGGKGIGLGVAKALARESMDVVICGRSEPASAEAALREIEGLGVHALYCQCDIADKASRGKMLDEIKFHFRKLNLLVNNAGIAPPERKDILEASEASFETVMRVNLQGPYFLTQAVANWMLEQQRESEEFAGTIVNVSSISATVASVNRGEYCLSKAGVSMATKLWAVRLAEHGIPVYEVRPGIIATDMTAGVKEKYDKLIANGLVPAKRWGEPEDIGKIVAALARGDLPYATGTVVMADGGLTIERL